MKDPSESATLKIYRISMKLIICIICVNRSACTKFEKDPSNGCDPHYMDHGSSWDPIDPYILNQNPLSLN